MAHRYAAGNETFPGYPMAPVPTFTPACSGWTCLSEAEQFGIIMGVLAAIGMLGVLTLWFCRGQRWTRDRTGSHTADIQLQPYSGHDTSHSMPPYYWPHSTGHPGPPLPPHQQYFLQYGAYPTHLTYPAVGVAMIEGPGFGGAPPLGAPHLMPGGPGPLASHPPAPYPGVNMPTSQTYPYVQAGHPANMPGSQPYPHMQGPYPAANMTGSQSVPHMQGTASAYQYRQQQQQQYTPVPQSDGAPFQRDQQQQAYYGPYADHQAPDAESAGSAPYPTNIGRRRPTFRQRLMRMLRLPSGHASTVSAATTATRSIPRRSYHENQAPIPSCSHLAPSDSNNPAYMSGALCTPTPRSHVSHVSRARAPTPAPPNSHRSRRRPRSPSPSPVTSSEEGSGDECDDDEQREVGSTRADAGRRRGSSDRS